MFYVNHQNAAIITFWPHGDEAVNAALIYHLYHKCGAASASIRSHLSGEYKSLTLMSSSVSRLSSELRLDVLR